VASSSSGKFLCPSFTKALNSTGGYRIDIVVENLVIVELKATDCLEDIHTAQVLTYLRLSKMPLGLLINFNVPLLKNGFKRLAMRDNAPNLDW